MAVTARTRRVVRSPFYMVSTRMLRTGILIVLALAAGGCAVGGRGPDAPVEDRSTPSPADRPAEGEGRGVGEDWITGAPPPEPLEPAGDGQAAQTDTAVLALLAESDQRRRAGDPEAAAAALERALRIAPRDPLLWHRLAGVRLAQRYWNQADNLARKSLSLSGNDRRLQAANWRLIAQAREAMGDRAGAAEAERNADRLAP